MPRFIDSLFDAIINKLHEVFNNIESKIRGLQSTINNILDWAENISQWITDRIESLLNKIYNAWNKAVEKYNDIMRAAQAPKVLHQRSLSWLQDVKAPLKNYVKDIGPNSVIRSYDWGGDAGDAYRDSVSDQSEAGTEMAGVADKTSQILEDCSEAGNTLYSAILAAYVTAVAGIAAAAVESATIVGIPAALATIVTVFGVAATAFATALNAFTSFSNSITGGNRGFVQAMTDYSYGSEWPSATKTTS